MSYHTAAEKTDKAKNRHYKYAGIGVEDNAVKKKANRNYRGNYIEFSFVPLCTFKTEDES